MELFEQMQAKGCKPDSVTYGGLILAFEKGDQWRRALAAFDQMKNNNCRPDSVVYNTVVGALWNTGVVWAQAKAVQVWLQHNEVAVTSAAACHKTHVFCWQGGSATDSSMRKAVSSSCSQC